MDPSLDRLKKESIHKLPYAKVISVSVDGELKRKGVKVSSGRERQYEDPATSIVHFEVSGDSAEILYKSEDGVSGVWLNGFELVRHI